MKRIARFLALLALLAACPPSSWADPVTVTFDQPPCDAVSPGIYPGNCYAGVGLSVRSGNGVTLPFMFRIAEADDAVSPPNAAMPVPGFTYLRTEFQTPRGPFGTDAVSFHVTGSIALQPAWRVEFFSTDGELARFSGFDDQLGSYSLGGRIILGMRFFPGTNLQGIDNLTFHGTETPVVPEPATLLLTGSGLLAVVRRRSLVGQRRGDS